MLGAEPPANKALPAGEFDAGAPLDVTVPRSFISVQLVPFHISVFALCDGPYPPNIKPKPELPDPPAA